MTFQYPSYSFSSEVCLRLPKFPSFFLNACDSCRSLLIIEAHSSVFTPGTIQSSFNCHDSTGRTVHWSSEECLCRSPGGGTVAVWGLWMLAGRGVRLIIIQQLTLVHDSMMIPDLVQGNIQTHRNSNMYICAHTHV